MGAATFLPRLAEPIPSSSTGAGLYVHIPFCLRKCPYCSFFSEPLSGRGRERYLRALHRQAGFLADDGDLPGSVRTIFFGGGTPSVLPSEDLAGLLQACQRCVVVDQDGMECSIEVNPATVDEADLIVLARAGFNRLSIGVQSFVDAELRLLGRLHDAAAAHAVIRAARRAGFANLNLDLIYGLPGQGVADWRQTLEAALAHEPEHLAVYELTVEENTPFALRQERGELDLPREDTVLSMMELTLQLTRRAGLRRYEISNYARPGRECRHNVNYWHNGDYLGLGAGAVSYLQGRRCRSVEDVDRFCEAVELDRPVWTEVEALEPEARFRESVVMGLRLTGGVSMTALAERFGLHPFSYYGGRLQRLADQGLLVMSGDILRLSDQGLNLANRVMAELV